MIFVYFLPKIDSSEKICLWKEQQTKINAGKSWNKKQDKQTKIWYRSKEREVRE